MHFGKLFEPLHIGTSEIFLDGFENNVHSKVKRLKDNFAFF